MKKGHYSKFLVSLVILLNVIFAIAVLIVFWHTGAEPSALVAAWFAFTTGELWLLAAIKKAKVKRKDEGNENQLETEIEQP